MTARNFLTYGLFTLMGFNYCFGKHPERVMIFLMEVWAFMPDYIQSFSG
jgi:hypothetical protein